MTDSYLTVEGAGFVYINLPAACLGLSDMLKLLIMVLWLSLEAVTTLPPDLNMKESQVFWMLSPF